MTKNEHIQEGSIVRIKLTQNQWATIDEKNLELINKYKWRAHWKSNGKTFYATTWARDPNTKKRHFLSMHRLILGATDPKIFIDHINHDTLNNTEANLRLATCSQNLMNKRRSLTNSSSKFKGVSWEPDRRKWKAKIKINKKEATLGRFESETEAALCYNNAAIKHFGEFALLNVIS